MIEYGTLLWDKLTILLGLNTFVSTFCIAVIEFSLGLFLYNNGVSMEAICIYYSIASLSLAIGTYILIKLSLMLTSMKIMIITRFTSVSGMLLLMHMKLFDSGFSIAPVIIGLIIAGVSL